MSLIYDALKQDDDNGAKKPAPQSSLALHQHSFYSISKYHVFIAGISLLVLASVSIFVLQKTNTVQQIPNESMHIEPLHLFDQAKAEQALQLVEPLKDEQALQLAEQLKKEQASQLAEQLKNEQALQLAEQLKNEQALQLAEQLKEAQALQLAEQLKDAQALQLAEQLKNEQALQLVEQAKEASSVRIVKSESATISNKRQHLNTVKKLVGQLKAAMKSENSPQVETLLSELENKTSSNSLVVLRMKGYYALQQGKNLQSQQFYQQLLIDKPEDLEENLNLALLDIRLGNHKQAKTRLDQMRSLYPSSISVKQFAKSLALMGVR